MLFFSVETFHETSPQSTHETSLHYINNYTRNGKISEKCLLSYSTNRVLLLHRFIIYLIIRAIKRFEKSFHNDRKNKKNSIFAAVMIRGVAQLASALAWGARGRKFESSHPDIEKKKARFLPCFFCYYAIAWLSSSANFWTERLIFSCVRWEGWRLPQTYCDSCALLIPVIRDMPDNVRIPL